MTPSDPGDPDTGSDRSTTKVLSGSLPSEREAQGPRRPVLVVVQGEEIGRRYLLNEPRLVIGRDPRQSDLVLPDRSVSARHAEFQLEPEEGTSCRIVDLESRNGSWRNGEAVESASLRDGDTLRFGTSVLKFTFHDAIEESFYGELDRLMSHDELTGLYVRRYFEREWPRAFARAREEERPLCVAMLDMDGLKAVNDRMGHQAGSAWIAEVGRRIRHALPEEGAAARFGGDEFVAWLPEHDLEAGEEVAEKIRRAVSREPVEWEGQTLYPTVSIGVAALEPGVSRAEELVRLADEALYRAKKAGRNTVSR